MAKIAPMVHSELAYVGILGWRRCMEPSDNKVLCLILLYDCILQKDKLCIYYMYHLVTVTQHINSIGT